MKAISIVLLSIFLSACATGYHKYSLAGGYKDKQVGENEYLVEFYGNGVTSRDTVEKYWAMRASELCPNGYKIFEKEDGANDASYTGAVGSLIIHPWKKATIQCGNQ